jgi:hypothetical protein
MISLPWFANIIYKKDEFHAHSVRLTESNYQSQESQVFLENTLAF